MNTGHRMTNARRWQAIGQLVEGQLPAKVARSLNVHRSTISRLWNRYRSEGTASRRSGVGRPRVTSARDDRYLRLQVRRHRSRTARQLAGNLAAATGHAVSRQTVTLRLHKHRLYARRPIACVPGAQTISEGEGGALTMGTSTCWLERRPMGSVLFTDE